MSKETQKIGDPKIKKPIIKKFKGVLEDPGLSIDAAFISFPYDVHKIFGTRGQVKVKVTFDGYPYRGILSIMGGGKHAILVRKDVRQAIEKKIGDEVDVVVEQDLEERIVDMPKPLQDLLKKNSKAKSFFDSLSFTNRKEYALWIASAKREETRIKRLEATLAKLIAGKKNPSEK
jgi:hypothetical protein